MTNNVTDVRELSIARDCDLPHSDCVSTSLNCVWLFLSVLQNDYVL